MLKVIFLSIFLTLVACSFRKVSVDDEEVKDAVNYAIKAFNQEKIPGSYVFKLVWLVDALKEDDGSKYDVSFIVGTTKCKTNEVKYEDIADCELLNRQNIYEGCRTLLSRDKNGNYKRKGSASCFPIPNKQYEDALAEEEKKLQ